MRHGYDDNSKDDVEDYQSSISGNGRITRSMASKPRLDPPNNSRDEQMVRDQAQQRDTFAKEIEQTLPQPIQTDSQVMETETNTSLVISSQDVSVPADVTPPSAEATSAPLPTETEPPSEISNHTTENSNLNHDTQVEESVPENNTTNYHGSHNYPSSDLVLTTNESLPITEPTSKQQTIQNVKKSKKPIKQARI